jgi:hypothetical protein
MPNPSYPNHLYDVARRSHPFDEKAPIAYMMPRYRDIEAIVRGGEDIHQDVPIHR